MRVPATDDGGAAALFLVDVAPVAGGPHVQYLVAPRDGVVEVGHGMCSGPFELAPGGRYRVTLAAVDLAGHTVVAPGSGFEIVGPMPRR